jgi:hypothetical protein
VVSSSDYVGSMIGGSLRRDIDGGSTLLAQADRNSLNMFALRFCSLFVIQPLSILSLLTLESHMKIYIPTKVEKETKLK